MEKFDIIVVGGGLSGVCGAIAAARRGAKVLLADKGNSLGGAAANGLVNPFAPMRTMIDGKYTQLNAGVFAEILDELRKFDAVNISGTVFNEEYLKLVLNRMAVSSGVNLLYHAYLSKVNTKDGAIKSVEFATKSGLLTFEANIFIDATGDADLAYGAGCPVRLGRNEDNLCQPMTMCFRMANVDVKKFIRENKKINELYKKHQEEGKIKNPRENVLVFPTLTEDVLHLNSTRVCKLNPVDAFDLTKAEIEVREQVFELYFFLRDNFDFCKNATLSMTASAIGVRESRMIDGEYLLTGEDIINCRKFSDSIAAGNYSIDIHSPDGSGTIMHRFKQGEYYTIPYRCLLPKKISNLLVAGRCISFDHEAQAACRVMPICASLGQAAATAAVISAKGNKPLREIDVREIQNALREDKAFF